MTVTTSLEEMGFLRAWTLVQRTDWHANLPEDVFRRACEHSVCFGVIDGGELVAFARVVTDHATYAYLCDVIVHPDHRGRGHASALVEATRAHPDIAQVRRYALLTRHSAGLYRKHGFVDGDDAVTYLEVHQPKYGREA